MYSDCECVLVQDERSRKEPDAGRAQDTAASQPANPESVRPEPAPALGPTPKTDVVCEKFSGNSLGYFNGKLIENSRQLERENDKLRRKLEEAITSAKRWKIERDNCQEMLKEVEQETRVERSLKDVALELQQAAEQNAARWRYWRSVWFDIGVNWKPYRAITNAGDIETVEAEIDKAIAAGQRGKRMANDPNSWNTGDYGVLVFATAGDAKRAEQLFNTLQTKRREDVRKCADICDLLRLASEVKQTDLHRSKASAFKEAAYEIRAAFPECFELPAESARR